MMIFKKNLDYRVMYVELAATETEYINTASLTTGWGSQGDWIIYENDGNQYILFFEYLIVYNLELDKLLIFVN